MVYEIVFIMMSGILLITGLIYKKYRIAAASGLLMLFSLSSVLMYCVFSVKYILTLKIFAYSILTAVTAVAICFSLVHTKFAKTLFSVVTVGLAGLICFMACIFIGITTKSLYGKNYIGIYEKMNKKPETVVTYYESKGFLLVSAKCSFEGNYQTGEVD
jgi:hypothetical protein